MKNIKLIISIMLRRHFVLGAVYTLFTLQSIYAQHDSLKNKEQKKAFNTDHYADIVRNSIKYNGSFSIYEKGDKYYLEIPDSLLERPITIFSRVTKALFGSGYQADDLIDKQRTMQWHKEGNNIFLVEKNYNIWPTDTSSTLFPVLAEINRLKIIATYLIAARSSNNASVIDATSLFSSTDVLSVAAKKINFVESNANFFAFSAEKNLPALQNATKQSAPTYNSDPPKGGNTEVKSIFYLLPKYPMHPRIADERVGYQTISFLDFGGYNKDIKEKKVILRWDLSGQKKLMVYIDPLTPKKWISYIKKGVNAWQSAFDKIGIKNAIDAKVGNVKDTASDLQSARLVIMYSLSPSRGKDLSFVSDPRSGEIIQCHISFNHYSIGQMEDAYRLSEAVNDPAARTLSFPEEITGMLISTKVTQQIGFALGLDYNFIASSSYPVDSLRHKNWLQKYGTSASVMDIDCMNYVAQPQDQLERELLMPKIGPYDDWAISWAYNPAIQNDDLINGIPLTRWTDKQLSDNHLWWSDSSNNDLGNDPRIQQYDLGDDEIKASTYGMLNLQRTIQALPQWTGKENDDETKEMYSQLLSPNGSLYTRYVNNVICMIGGLYLSPLPLHNDSLGAYPVPKETQKAAMNFLKQYVFKTPEWSIDRSLLARLKTNPLVVMQETQENVLRTLIEQKADLLVKQEMTFGRNIYSVSDLLDDLYNIIWENDNNQMPDIWHQLAQSSYTDVLLNFYKTRKDRSISSSIIGNRLTQLRNELNRRLNTTTNSDVKAHYNGLLYNLTSDK